MESWKRLLGILLVLSSALPSIPPAWGRPRAEQPEAGRTVTVVGEGEARAEPDTAIAQLGVETFASAVEQALAENRRRMNGVMEALRGAGIDPQDIQTLQYNVSFERYPPDPQVPEGQGEAPAGSYRVLNLVNVIVRRLEELGTLLDRATEAGANQIWGIQFTRSDPQAVQEQARARAVENARERAEQLAAQAGVELGVLLSISEVAGEPGIEPRFAMAEGLGGGQTPIAPGQLVFHVRVQATWQIQ